MLYKTHRFNLFCEQPTNTSTVESTQRQVTQQDLHFRGIINI